MGSWAYTRPPDVVCETGKDRTRFAGWRPVPLSRRAHPEPRADVRFQPRSDASKQGCHGSISEKGRGAALDPTRLRRQCQAQEVARLLRLVPFRRELKATGFGVCRRSEATCLYNG